MTANLTTLIARAQALLLDSGTAFTTATLTAAFREALRQFNSACPIAAATTIDAAAGQLEYALNDADFSGLLSVYGVWLRDPEGENDEPLPCHVYYEDNAPFIRLQEPEAAGGSLLVRYALPHTISGLDGGAESTLVEDQENALTDGACEIAIESRLTSRVETINLAPGVVQNYQRAAGHFRDAFKSALALYAMRRVGTGRPSTAAWDDAYHGWEQ
jgi:hypothetical protein